MKIFGPILCIILFGLLVFFCLDCGVGKTRYLECYVADREYKPAWTEISSHTDSDGHTHFSTTRHPEEFHVFCQELSAGVIDVSTTRSIYHIVTNNQSVTVKIREGKWSGIKWMPQIELN